MAFLNALAGFGRHPSAHLLRRLVAGPLRFTDLLGGEGKTDEPALSASLRELDAAGLLKRRVDPGPPLRVLYELTPEGRELAPALASLAVWAERRPENADQRDSRAFG